MKRNGKNTINSQDLKAQMSALVDDELPEAEKSELVKQLKTDPDLQKTWGCYHLIRQVMQRKSDKLLLGYGAMLFAKVHAQIEKEPTAVWGAEFDKPIVMNTSHTNPKHTQKG